MSWPTGGGTHLDEELSAYLDGELDDAGYRHAYHHLSTCGECRAQLDALSSVRTTLRTAPPIEPPFGFIERVVSGRRRSVAPVVATVLGLAAVWLLILGFLAGGPVRVDPPVADIAAAQAGFEPGDVDGRGAFAANDIEFAPADRDDIPETFRAPEELSDGQFAAGFQAVNRDGWLVMYEVDDEPVAVYQQLGEYNPSSLPGDGERFEIDTDPAWRGSIDGRNAVVVQRDAMTYTVVGEADVEELIELAEELPAREEASPPSVGERLVDAANRFLESMALGA
jgi:hypothetical protein